MFVKLKTGEFRHVVETNDGVITVQDETGVQTKITPEQIEVQVTKWYQIIKLVLQFAGVLIGLFKK